MKKLFRKLKRVNKFARSIFFITIIGYIISYLFFVKSVISLTGIETVIRYVLLLLFLIYLFYYIYISVNKLLKKKYVGYYILTLISIILIIIFSFGARIIDVFYGRLSDFNENEKVIYTSYLISLKDTTLNSKSILAMVEDENDIEGNILAKKIIKENNLSQTVKKYKDNEEDVNLEMLYDLYEGKVDAIFISSNFVTLYSSEQDFNNISEETKVLYQASGEYTNKDSLLKSNKSLTEPFTALIMGVDSEYEGLNANAAFNGDTLMLATINPHTLTATLLSIPRDTYVPIACRKNSMAKINSSAASGTSCVIDTIENLMDIEIDYYAKINFKGVVDLVEAVGGIEVEVEEPDYQYNHGFNCNGMVCEQNSDRKWGKDTIFIEPGWQLLNGEEALAYSRCRGLYMESDLARNRHQQDIIMSLVKKMLQLDSYSKFKDVIDAVSNNISTNMSVNQILSSYNILKDMVANVIKDEEIIDIKKASLEIYDLEVYLPSSGRMSSALGYYQDSLDDIIKTMKINLELEDPEIIKTFNYSINETYEARVAGKGLRSGASNSVLTNYVGKSKNEAEKYCAANDLDCSFKYVDESSQYYNSKIETDKIASQKPNGGTLLNEVDDVTFYINGASLYDN